MSIIVEETKLKPLIIDGNILRPEISELMAAPRISKNIVVSMQQFDNKPKIIEEETVCDQPLEHLDKDQTQKDIIKQIYSKTVVLDKRKHNLEDDMKQGLLQAQLELLDYHTFKKPYNVRNYVENRYCIKSLERIPFFLKSYNDMLVDAKNIGAKAKSFENFLEECSKYLYYQQFYAGDYICHKGDSGNKMYIILTGEVNVLVPKTQAECESDFTIMSDTMKKLEMAPFYRPPRKKDAFEKASILFPKKTLEELKKTVRFDDYLASLIYKRSEFPQILGDDFQTLGIGKQDTYYKKGVFEYKRVNTLRQHQIVGELALIRNTKRAATQVVKVDAALLTLTKTDFESVFACTLKSEGEKNFFFESMFAGYLSKPAIIDIQNSFKEEIVQRGKVLFKEGDIVDSVYQVKQGDIYIYKNDVKGVSNRKKVLDDARFYTNGAKNLMRIEIAKTQKINSDLIGMVSEYGFVGEEDALLKSKKRSFTAVSMSSPTQVYKITIELWEQKSQLLGELLEILKKRSVGKLDWKDDQLKKFGEMKKVIHKTNHLQSIEKDLYQEFQDPATKDEVKNRFLKKCDNDHFYNIQTTYDTLNTRYQTEPGKKSDFFGVTIGTDMKIPLNIDEQIECVGPQHEKSVAQKKNKMLTKKKYTMYKCFGLAAPQIESLTGKDFNKQILSAQREKRLKKTTTSAPGTLNHNKRNFLITNASRGTSSQGIKPCSLSQSSQNFNSRKKNLNKTTFNTERSFSGGTNIYNKTFYSQQLKDSNTPNANTITSDQYFLINGLPADNPQQSINDNYEEFQSAFHSNLTKVEQNRVAKLSPNTKSTAQLKNTQESSRMIFDNNNIISENLLGIKKCAVRSTRNTAQPADNSNEINLYSNGNSQVVFGNASNQRSGDRIFKTYKDKYVSDIDPLDKFQVKIPNGLDIGNSTGLHKGFNGSNSNDKKHSSLGTHEGGNYSRNIITKKSANPFFMKRGDTSNNYFSKKKELSNADCNTNDQIRISIIKKLNNDSSDAEKKSHSVKKSKNISNFEDQDTKRGMITERVGGRVSTNVSRPIGSRHSSLSENDNHQNGVDTIENHKEDLINMSMDDEETPGIHKRIKKSSEQIIADEYNLANVKICGQESSKNLINDVVGGISNRSISKRDSSNFLSNICNNVNTLKKVSSRNESILNSSNGTSKKRFDRGERSGLKNKSNKGFIGDIV